MPLKWHKALVLVLTGALLCSFFLPPTGSDTLHVVAFIWTKAFLGIGWGLAIGAYICLSRWGKL